VLVTVINFGRIGTCKLCQREAELQNSHVLSEFLYRELYDDKHRLAALSQDRKPKSLQTGVKEPMLCRACEQGFSKWETYAARKLADLPSTSDRAYGSIISYHGVDYARFKLFKLSLIWRMGAASHATFSGVSLGPLQEDLRRMLISSDPGEPLEYPVLLASPFGRGPFEKWLCIPHSRQRIFGHNVYEAFMGTLYWLFFMCRRASHIRWRNSFLSHEGVLTIHVYEGRFEDFYLNQWRMIKRLRVQL
jgi:hypothetical protein